MPFDLINLEATGFAFLKIGAIIGMTLYVVFAFVVLRQVKIMTHTLEVNFERPLQIIATAHLAISVFVLIFSLVM